MGFTVSTAAMFYLPFQTAPPAEPCWQCKAGMRESRECFSTALREQQAVRTCRVCGMRRPSPMSPPARGYSGEHEVRYHVLAPRLGAEEECQAPAGCADHATDQHRPRKPEIMVNGEIGYHRRHNTAEYCPQMIAEGGRRSPRLGRKPLCHVRRHLAAGATAEQCPLHDKADHDYPVVVAEHIPERHRDPQ